LKDEEGNISACEEKERLREVIIAKRKIFKTEITINPLVPEKNFYDSEANIDETMKQTKRSKRYVRAKKAIAMRPTKRKKDIQSKKQT